MILLLQENLKYQSTVHYVLALDQSSCSYVYDHLKDIPEIFILGPSPKEVPRLPIFSLVLFHIASGKYLHYNFVCSLLSDLFGIQARGGCSCAGPYAQVNLMLICVCGWMGGCGDLERSISNYKEFQ